MPEPRGSVVSEQPRCLRPGDQHSVRLLEVSHTAIDLSVLWKALGTTLTVSSQGGKWKICMHTRCVNIHSINPVASTCGSICGFALSETRIIACAEGALFARLAVQSLYCSATSCFDQVLRNGTGKLKINRWTSNLHPAKTLANLNKQLGTLMCLN